MSGGVQLSEGRYVLIGGTRVFLNAEQLRMWNRFINEVRNDARRMRTCGMTDYRRCCGDCGLCKYQMNGAMYHLDQDDEEQLYGHYPEAHHLYSIQMTPEETICYEETVDLILELAAKTVERGEEIMFLRIRYEMTIRDIAIELGMSKSLVAKRICLITETLLDCWDEVF